MDPSNGKFNFPIMIIMRHIFSCALSQFQLNEKNNNFPITLLAGRIIKKSFSLGGRNILMFLWSEKLGLRERLGKESILNCSDRSRFWRAALTQWTIRFWCSSAESFTIRKIFVASGVGRRKFNYHFNWFVNKET